MNRSLLGLLNASPFFATRPFLVTLLIALLARFTDMLTAPAWFVSNEALAVMGGLAIIEVLGSKTDLGRYLDEFTPLAKGILSFLLVLILVLPTLDGNPANFGPLEERFLASVDSSQWGIEWLQWGIALIGSVLTSGSVWLLGWLRSGILSALVDLDEEDDIGVQGYFSWFEDFWTIIGTLIAFFFPLFALSIYGATILLLFLVQRYVDHIQEKRKLACTSCDQPMLATALYCPHCDQPNLKPHAVGVFGQSLDEPSTDPHEHYHRLLTRKRCPSCATRLPERLIQQTCKACGTVTFANSAELDDYLAKLRQALPQTLAICFALSFVPILGILPGVIYYRLTFISSFRGYLQRPVVFFLRVTLLIFNLLLISIQWIPFLGAISIPIMCLTNYWLYRAMLVRSGTKRLSGSAQPYLSYKDVGNGIDKGQSADAEADLGADVGYAV